jgi:heat shock protein HslJ
MIRGSIFLLSILTACFTDETVSGQTDEQAVWMLSTMNGAPVSTRITITFPEEGRIAGQAACNKYFGSQTMPMPWFEVKNLGATKMACPDLGLEVQYFETLQQTTTAEIIGDMLILRTDTGNALVFKN